MNRERSELKGAFRKQLLKVGLFPHTDKAQPTMNSFQLHPRCAYFGPRYHYFALTSLTEIEGKVY